MSDKIAVDPEVIALHISKVEDVAAEVGVAASAARSMNLAGGAFGLMCSFLVAPAVLATTVAGSSIGAVEKALGRSARELKAAVKDFDYYEADVETFATGTGKLLSGGGGATPL